VLGLVAVLGMLPGCSLLSAVRVPPGAGELRFSGRVDWSDPAGPRFAWSGTSLTVRFTGTSIGLRLMDLPKKEELRPNRFRWSVDGQPWRDLYLEQRPVLYRVAEHLPPGEHVLRLEKETEALVGEVQLLGVVLDPGARVLPAPPAPSRRLEFIGDSGLTGFGIEGKDEKCRFSSETQRASLTWPLLTAQALEAEPFLLAVSGKGVAVNYNDDPAPTMAQLYERTLPDREDSRWDFQAWQPDAVLIQLGSNDFWKRHPGTARFRGAYEDLVRSLRARYPRAHIVCLLGPGLFDDWPPGVHARASARALLADMVEGLRQEGEARVHLVEVPVRTKEEGLGCQWHPSALTHQRVAAQLTAVLRELLGWQ
jgi:lysophospholipase L1-like esterase